jgi:NAD(P)H-flavin reductase
LDGVPDLAFLPGQYVNLLMPGTDQRRSYSGSFEFRVGYAALALIRVKSSFPAMRKRTVRMVAKRV